MSTTLAKAKDLGITNAQLDEQEHINALTDLRDIAIRDHFGKPNDDDADQLAYLLEEHGLDEALYLATVASISTIASTEANYLDCQSRRGNRVVSRTTLKQLAMLSEHNIKMGNRQVRRSEATDFGNYQSQKAKLKGKFPLMFNGNSPIPELEDLVSSSLSEIAQRNEAATKRLNDEQLIELNGLRKRHELNPLTDAEWNQLLDLQSQINAILTKSDSPNTNKRVADSQRNAAIGTTKPRQRKSRPALPTL